MSWKVRISSRAREDLDQLRAYDSELYSQAYLMVRSIERDPFEGIGSPGRLSLIGPNVWYRRLSLVHRIVYEVSDELVVIVSFRLHIE